MKNVLCKPALKITIQYMESNGKILNSFYLFSNYRNPSGKFHKSQIRSENKLLLVYLSQRGQIFTFQPGQSSKSFTGRSGRILISNIAASFPTVAMLQLCFHGKSLEQLLSLVPPVYTLSTRTRYATSPKVNHSHFPCFPNVIYPPFNIQPFHNTFLINL